MSNYTFLYAADEECISITGLQLPGVLDELFSYDGPLGATFSSDSVSLHLWAPTAQVNAIPIIFYFSQLQITGYESFILSFENFFLFLIYKESECAYLSRT